MNLSYNSSKKALEYRFFFPQQSIFDARDAIDSNFTINLFSNIKEEQLIQFICKKDSTEITKWIKQFAEETVANYQTKNLLFIRVYSILGHILKFLYDMNIKCDTIEKKIIQVFTKIEFFTSSDELYEWLNQICQDVCSELTNSVKVYHDKICESVTGYIDKNYGNNTLTLNTIADFVNLSPSHLSALYKKNTGINITNAITNTRINAACILIQNSSYSFKEISSQVGYTNQYYFSSCFKKQTGMTPSQYRTKKIL